MKHAYSTTVALFSSAAILAGCATAPSAPGSRTAQEPSHGATTTVIPPINSTKNAWGVVQVITRATKTTPETTSTMFVTAKDTPNGLALDKITSTTNTMDAATGKILITAKSSYAVDATGKVTPTGDTKASLNDNDKAAVVAMPELTTAQLKLAQQAADLTKRTTVYLKTHDGSAHVCFSKSFGMGASMVMGQGVNLNVSEGKDGRIITGSTSRPNTDFTFRLSASGVPQIVPAALRPQFDKALSEALTCIKPIT